ncbi:hypothetical protein [Alcanivorax sp.]
MAFTHRPPADRAPIPDPPVQDDGQ